MNNHQFFTKCETISRRPGDATPFQHASIAYGIDKRLVGQVTPAVYEHERPPNGYEEEEMVDAPRFRACPASYSKPALTKAPQTRRFLTTI